MANPVKTLDDLCKRIEEEFAIAVIFENRLAVISARREMIKRPVVFDS